MIASQGNPCCERGRPLHSRGLMTSTVPRRWVEMSRSVGVIFPTIVAQNPARIPAQLTALSRNRDRHLTTTTLYKTLHCKNVIFSVGKRLPPCLRPINV